MSLLRFCEWLASTPGSIALHESHYAYLGLLAIHVLTVAVFVGTIAMIDLRLLGLTMVGAPVSDVMARLLPWSAAGLVVMLVSGALLFYAAPVLGYHNLFFRFKMVALALAIINAWTFHRRIYHRVTDWDRDPVPPATARMAAGISLILWAAIITAGRMMPYQIYWFD
jgi:hypothetical protein